MCHVRAFLTSECRSSECQGNMASSKAGIVGTCISPCTAEDTMKQVHRRWRSVLSVSATSDQILVD